ncbi:hypothetical protein [Usitatibacter rugosus]|uniref:hypothetical protein n=1 Tax=Usitatibacter rugosus TaxID=2732067 RepID=UPI001489EE7C|nr:hypothetical protein [Usitatibacter rugosus]
MSTSKSAPPPFWQQLPRVFTYPMHGDAMVKIVVFALFVAITSHIGFLAYILSRLAWLAFMAYCFRILERTARGHLVPGDYVDDRTNKDRRPLMQVGIIFVFMFLAIMIGVFVGKIAGQIALILVALALPASIMVLALDERFFAAINPVRLLEVIAGIGLPYFALCVFLFLLLQSAQFLGAVLDDFMPVFVSQFLADAVTMYFMVSMYYLMGYALYQHHEELGVDVQVDTAMAQRALAVASGKKVEPELLGPQTQGLLAEAKLGEAAERIENRLKREWDNNKLQDQYHKVLMMDGKEKPIIKHVNEYLPKLIREKRGARAVDIYEAAKKKIPDLTLADSTIILPLATAASDLRRDTIAVELLKGFDKRYPGHEDIPGVYMLVGKIMLERQNQYAMAQKVFQAIVAKFPQHKLAAEAAKMAEIAGKMAAQALSSPSSP